MRMDNTDGDNEKKCVWDVAFRNKASSVNADRGGEAKNMYEEDNTRQRGIVDEGKRKKSNSGRTA
jgi:hypothetical protein